MKPPVEHVKVSAKGKDILIKIKRYTGIEHWNELCRIALCRSLANPAAPATRNNYDNALDIEWTTFAGAYQNELSALIYYRARKDGIALDNSEELYIYFRNHLERGILSLNNIKKLERLGDMY